MVSNSTISFRFMMIVFVSFRSLILFVSVESVGIHENERLIFKLCLFTVLTFFLCLISVRVWNDRCGGFVFEIFSGKCSCFLFWFF